MRTFVTDRTCWSLLLTALAIRLRNKPTYDKLRVLIINKDVRKSLACKNGNENPIWSWNDSGVGWDIMGYKSEPLPSYYELRKCSYSIKLNYTTSLPTPQVHLPRLGPTISPTSSSLESAPPP